MGPSILDFEAKVTEYFRKSLENPMRVLEQVAIYKHVRQRADRFPNPINMVYPEETIIENRVTHFASLCRDFWDWDRTSEKEELSQWMVNHFRLVQFLRDRDFEDGLEKYKQFEALFGKEVVRRKIASTRGYMDMRTLFRGDTKIGEVPFVFLRDRLKEDITQLGGVRQHEDSHAFSKVFDKEVERVYGYTLRDDGEGEINLREWVEEWIADIESGATRLDSDYGMFTVWTLNDENGVKKVEEKGERLKGMIGDLRKEVLDNMTLAMMLRVISVQVMEKTLPKVVKEYRKNGLPKYEPISK